MVTAVTPDDIIYYKTYNHIIITMDKTSLLYCVKHNKWLNFCLKYIHLLFYCTFIIL